MIKILIIISALSAAFAAGLSVNGWRLGLKISDMEKQWAQQLTRSYEQEALLQKSARRIEADNAEKTALVNDRARTREELRIEQSRKTEKRLIEYVQNPVSYQCGLDSGFVSIYDDSLLLPGASGVSIATEGARIADESARTVRNAIALPIITRNNERCAEYRDQVMTCVDFFRTHGMAPDDGP